LKRPIFPRAEVPRKRAQQVQVYRSRSRDSCRECGFGAQLNCDDCRKFTVDWLALSMTRLPSRDMLTSVPD